MDRSDPALEERRRRRPRWHKWVLLGLVVLALRLAFSAAAASLFTTRLSHALGTRVEIGGVSFQPLDAIFTLRDVIVHAPARAGAPADTTPPIVADRVRIDVQWLPLVHRTLRVRELALESARVELDRFADGRFGLSNLEHPAPSGELPEGWSFAFDRLALRSSRLRVRDLAAGGAAWEATLRDAAISGFRRHATVFGKAKNVRVDALVAGGQLRVDGHYELRDDGAVLDALLRVKDVPLAQAKNYVAHLGWTDLSGRVSGKLRWRREPRRRDLLSGRIVVHRGSVRVADLTEPALAARRGVADVAAIDLVNRRIAIGSLTLHGATLALRPDAGAPIPLIAAANLRAPHPGASRAPRQSASPWNWMIERFDAADARLRVVTADGWNDLSARAFGENLGPSAYWSPLHIEVVHDETAAMFDGTVRLTDGVVIEGRLSAGGIDVPGLARAAALPGADLVQAGRATADLTVQLDTASSDSPPLYASGAIAVTDLYLTAPEPCTFAFGSAAVDLTLEGFSLGEPARAKGSDGGPAQIRFSSANIRAPHVLLLRTVDGWILPPATETPTGETAEIVVDEVRADAGSLIVVDQVPIPAVIWDVKRVDGTVRDFSLPALSFAGLQLRGSDRTFGRLQIGGSSRGGANSFEATGEGVPLAATAPYLKLAGLPYRFDSGRGSFNARGAIGAARWRADATLTLQAPGLVDSETLEQAIGMPVPSALALLQDPSGDVNVQMVLTPPRAGDRETYADQIAAGIRETIRTVTEAARGEGELPEVSVLFAPGQVRAAMRGMDELEPIGELLRSRPHLIVELTADTSHADRRWIAEQALRGRLEGTGGFRRVLRAIGVSDARARIRTALDARAHGAPGFLDSDDEALLTRLISEAPPIDDSRLEALLAARLAAVTKQLSEGYGIDGERIVPHGIASREGTRLPAVRVHVAIGPDPEPVAPPPSSAAAPGVTELPPAATPDD